MKKLTSKFVMLILVISSFSVQQVISAEKSVSSCAPRFFDKITVKNDAVEIIDIQISGYVNRFVIKPDREMDLYGYDNKGNQKFLEEKQKYIFADIGDELGERLELLEWNDNTAVFKLIPECYMPACEMADVKDCVFKITDNWERKGETYDFSFGRK